MLDKLTTVPPVVNRSDGGHFRQQGFGVLLVGSGDGAEQDADLPEVMHIPQFPEDTVIQVELQIENSLAAIRDLHLDVVVRQRLDSFDVPIHGGI